MNYLDIVVDATLSLTNSPENIGLKAETPGTKVKPSGLKKDLNELLGQTFVVSHIFFYPFGLDNDNLWDNVKPLHIYVCNP